MAPTKVPPGSSRHRRAVATGEDRGAVEGMTERPRRERGVGEEIGRDSREVKSKEEGA